MSTNRFTEAEWRAFCATQWPDLAERAALTTKAHEVEAERPTVVTEAEWAAYCRKQWPDLATRPTGRSRGFGRRAR